MNNIDKQYQNLLSDILNNGVVKSDRTGTGTISVFGRQIRHKMSEGFPLLTTKKMYFNGIVAELLWFLQGNTDIRYLWKNNCHIWDGDWYKAYSKSCSSPYSLEEMIKFGLEWEENPRNFHKSIWELGPIYGKQWRKWGSGFGNKNVDQIENLINDLKNNPDSRRLMVNAWNVGELDLMTLPPCHYGFQVYTRELSLDEREAIFRKRINGLQYILFSLEGEEGLHKEYDKQNVPRRAISLMWNQRSVDVPLGLPFNIASYGLLLMMLADEVNMIPDELIGNLGDCHIYLNQKDGAIEQISREPYELPQVHVRDGIYCSSVNDVVLQNYKCHASIKYPLSN